MSSQQSPALLLLLLPFFLSRPPSLSPPPPLLPSQPVKGFIVPKFPAAAAAAPSSFGSVNRHQRLRTLPQSSSSSESSLSKLLPDSSLSLPES